MDAHDVCVWEGHLHFWRRQCIDPADRRRIERLEIFDEFEEWHLIQVGSAGVKLWRGIACVWHGMACACMMQGGWHGMAWHGHAMTWRGPIKPLDGMA